MTPSTKTEAPPCATTSRPDYPKLRPDDSTPPPEIAMAIMAVRPVQAQAKGDFSIEQMTCNATGYEIARAIRRAMCTENEHHALLDMDTIEPLLERYAKRHSLPFDVLAVEVELLWPDSCGPHRDPWQGALQRYERNPQLIRLSERNESLNRLATLAWCLHDVTGGAQFMLPVVKTGKQIDLSKEQVSRLIKVLEKRALLLRVEDYNREENRAAVFTFQITPEIEHVTGMQQGSYRYATGKQQVVDRLLTGTQTIKPLKNESIKEKPIKAKKKTGCADECDPDYLAFQEQWNKLADECRLPKPRKVPPDRLKDFKAMAKDPHWEVECAEGMEKVRNSRYLQGKVNGFKCTIDWFLKPDNFAKILEGNYDDNKPATIQLGTGVESEGDKPW